MTRLRLLAMMASAPLAIALSAAGASEADRLPVNAKGDPTVTLYEPCVLAGPLMKVIRAYKAGQPRAGIITQTYKPSELPSKPTGPALVVTAGDIEMARLVKSGLVNRADVRTFAFNTYAIAVIAAAGAIPEVRTIEDLGRPWVRRLLLDDPAGSSVGGAAKQALTKLGLWATLQGKIAYTPPGTMVPAYLIAGKADAAVVLKECLLEGGSPPKTVRVIGELPPRLYPPLPYQVAPLQASNNATLRGLLRFLMGPQAKQILRRAGLKPVTG